MMNYDKSYIKDINDLEELLDKVDSLKWEIQGKLFCKKIEYQRAKEKNGKTIKQ